MATPGRTAARAAWWVSGSVAALAVATPVLMVLGRSVMSPGDMAISLSAVVAGAGGHSERWER